MNPRPPGVERWRLHLVQWPSIAYLGAMTLKHLGKTSALPASPQEAVLDYVPNPRPDALYLVRFAAPEFTSLCPVTGQPDFARSEEHTSELQSLMRIPYAVFCLKKKTDKERKQ